AGPGRPRAVAAPRDADRTGRAGPVREPGGLVTAPRTAVVVGNPKPGSRTLAAAVSLAEQVTGAEPDLVVDLAEVGPGLLTWGDPTVAGLVGLVSSADLLVVASPTYKATFTGLLKLFLDQ